jgi:hypothetical protein
LSILLTMQGNPGLAWAMVSLAAVVEAGKPLPLVRNVELARGAATAARSAICAKAKARIADHRGARKDL